ncbi:MAG TPA: hypothetical protein VF294_03170, partial [Polyangiaceae bacterium]
MQAAEDGQGVEALQSAVQYPPLHAVPALVLCEGVHSAEAQSPFAAHAAPIWSILPTQLPVAPSQVSAEPQLKPWRQSGRQILADAEHTYPPRQSVLALQVAAQKELPSP